jgi:hypothetical protein
MADHTPVEPHADDIQRAQTMWHNVTQASKWGILAIIIIVSALAATFINWS